MNQKIKQHIEGFALPDKPMLASNGLAVAHGRLYAVCEGGTVLCSGQ